MFKKAAIAASVAALAGFGQAAWSASTSTPMAVSASVSNNCIISTAPTFAFGAYDPVSANLAANLDANTTLAIKCTKNSSGVYVGFTTGGNYTTTRRLTDGAGTPSFLDYELYHPSAVGAAATCPYSTIWGTTNPTDTFAVGAGNFTAGGTAVTVRVCGRIPAAQDVPAGTFNDSVTLQVNF